MTLVGVGLLLTGLATAVAGGWWGREAVAGSLVFGLVATSIQLVATRMLRRAWGGGTAGFFRAVGRGMMLRLGGVVLMGAAVVWDRTLFPPLPTAIGFLGVLIPLLFLEVRFVR
ncbi:MAG TPA: hypothetical protein VNJ71_10985 [Gemmatimonadales bacterium]|nr:hypothetical protein [Gemmatimonadales bacterium]